MKPLRLRTLILGLTLSSALLATQILVPGSALVAHATSFYERPFPETVKDAPVIVRGKVGTTFSDWGRGEDSNKRIYTYWDLQVQEVLKGQAAPAGQTVRMRELGGEKDGLAMQVAGTAHFNAGEEVVAFLSGKNTEGSYDVWGMMMGKFNVQKDAEGKETLSGPGINALTQGRIGEGDEGRADTRTASKWTLDRLRQLIASQGDAPGANARNAPQKPTLTPVAPISTETVQTPEPTASLAASQLQSSSAEEPTSLAASLAKGVAVAFLGWLLVSIWRRRRR